MFGGLGLGPFKKEKPFQTFQGYGGGAGGAGMAGAGQSPITATGGQKITDGDYTFHVWGSNAPASQAFSVSDGGPWNIDILVCGGGGGGGGKGNGGGGGGAVVHFMEWEIDGAPVATYPITRGSGGSKGSTTQSGFDGNDSVFGSGTPTPITAEGGGGGSGESSGGKNGGSGGGGGRGDSNKTVGEGSGAGVASPNGGNYVSPPAGWGQDGALGWYQGPHNNPAPNGAGGGGGTGIRTNDVKHGTYGFSTIPWLPGNLPGAGTYGYPNPGPHPQGYRGGAWKFFGAGGGGGGYDSQNGPNLGDGSGGGGGHTGPDGYDYCGGGGGGGNGGGEGGGNASPGGNGGSGCIIIRYKTSA